MSLPKLIDNKHSTLTNTLRTVATDHTHLSIATGYWDIEGTLLILDQLEKYESVRLLIGREPLLKRDNKGNTTEPELDYPDKDFFEDLINTNPTPEIKQAVITLYQMIEAGKLEVRVYRRTFLHAKCYIFGTQDSESAVGIVGSSNFTRAGLEGNSELNALESDHRIVLFSPKSDSQDTGHLAWFNELWSDEKTENWNGDFTELIRTSPIGDKLYSPKELYLRTLYELYNEEMQAEKEEILHPHSYKLFEFQEKNVKNLTRILNKHGVAMLADSVGLGKTMSCIGVIKQYKQQRVVVIAPASLKHQWEQELMRENLLHVRVISLQNKDEIKNAQSHDSYAPIGLFVIDESHNLRSNNAARYEILADWIANAHNESAHVLLATATPINNSLDDLVNQVLLGARGDQDVFTIPTISSEGQVVTRSFYEAVQNIKKRINQRIANGADEDELMRIYEESRFTLEPVIQSFVVRNTRQSIEKIVQEDGTEIMFPNPVVRSRTYEHAPLTRKASEELAQVHSYSVENLADTMDKMLHPMRQIDEWVQNNTKTKLETEHSAVYRLYQLILSLSFVPYRWRMYDPRAYDKTRDELFKIRFAKKEDKEAINRQISIYGIIRTTFLKRLESSAYALEMSLTRYEKRLAFFESFLKRQNVMINLSDIDDILDEYGAGDGDEIEYTDEQLAEIVSKQKTHSADGFHKDELLADIETEKKLIAELRSLVTDLKKDDAKFNDFRTHLLSEYKANPGKKILVFAFFSDTITYLKEKFTADQDCVKLLTHAEFVSGASGKDKLVAADRFSPVARKVTLPENTTELTHLFTTDVLSEGQNLQDSGHLINYDLHWNPVRMIQRNGRINRIGSKHTEVLVENYIPGDDLETFLGLVERLRRKIELIKHIVGTDSSVLGEDIDPRAFTGIYDADEAVAGKAYAELENKAGTFAEDSFKQDLINFYKTATETERRRVERIPYGTWTKNVALTAPNDVVTLATFSLSTNGMVVQKPFFFANEASAIGLDLLTRAQALRLIRSEDTERKLLPFLVNTDRHEQVSIQSGRQIIALNGGGEAGLTPTQKIVHEHARTHGWTSEEQDMLHSTIRTRNVIQQRKVNRLVRSINSLLKANGDTAEAYAELKKILKEPTNPPEVVDTTFNFGFSTN